MKNLFRFAAALTVALVVVACGGQGKSDAQWSNYASTNPVFSVDFPSKPTEERSTKDSMNILQVKAGDNVTYCIAMTMTPAQAELQQAFAANPGLVDTLEETIVAEFLQGAQATKVSESKISHNGLDGKELSYKGDGDKVHGKLRTFFKNNTFYVLAYADEGSKMAAGEEKRFFDTFKVQ